MFEIQRIVGPVLKGSERLFLESSGKSPKQENRNGRTVFDLEEGTKVSFGAYFNALFPKYAEETYGVGTYRFECEAIGNGFLSLEASEARGEKSNLYRQELRQGKNPISFEFKVKKGGSGFIYPVLEAKRGGLKFSSGRFLTLNNKERNGRLAVCICTFKREEYLIGSLKAWAQDSEIVKRAIFYISDNGQTLKPSDLPPGCEVRLFPNPNLGGSGGFARAFIEAKDEGKCDYYLFCDDDAIVHPESIYRTLAFFDSKKDPDAYLLSGAMLDFRRPLEAVEMGAKFLIEDSRVNSFYAGANLSRPDDLDSFSKGEPGKSANYSAFFFTGFAERKGTDSDLYPPYFLRGDDITFGLSRSRNGVEVLTYPGLAVWHEPFYSKTNSWVEYYNYRNYGIVHFLFHEGGPWRLAWVYFVRFYIFLYTFQYENLRAALEGIRQILAGPQEFVKLDLQQKHSELMGRYAPESVWQGSKPHTSAISKILGILFLPVSILSLNTISLPYFRRPIDRSAGVLSILRNGAGASVTLDYDERRDPVYIRKKDLFRSFRLALSALLTIVEVLVRHRRLSESWKREARHFSSETFWRSKLAPYR
ncbi:glycosyltransferase, group 2 family protein [Leptospira fluminis]|uniref:Glycosyltransferase, group 2 family protein n=1 Tax=Leptospira fluminis TaxID=2484979 RepID=A0A4V3JEB9_9LEPT|nr:glycosyltransferase [Leptospira fluminis]TGK17295.1 glycosyltransferase, group 2 family protein [Leptospira fluminis]